MLIDIHDMIMKRLHKKRDAMQQVNYIVLPKVKTAIKETVKQSSNVECFGMKDKIFK